MTQDNGAGNHPRKEGNTNKKLRLIFAIVKKDVTQIHRSGLPVLLIMSAILAVAGFAFFNIARYGSGIGSGGALHITGIPWITQGIEGLGGSVFFDNLNLLYLVYAYAVLVTIILVPVAFAINYNQEVKKGTVRVLTCYPVSVFDITIAKLIYSAIASFIFGLPVFMLPLLGLQKSPLDLFAIFIAAYLASLVIVAVGAFVANSITVATKKVYIQPPALAGLFAVLSFFISTAIISIMSLLLGSATSILQGLAALRPLSLYHEAGLMLAAGFGDVATPDWLILLLPTALLLAGMWLTLKLLPDIYEKD
jgi:ABC-type transport system involved in multi-copper enzyme maturation permease subunit